MERRQRKITKVTMKNNNTIYILMYIDVEKVLLEIITLIEESENTIDEFYED